MKHIQRFESFLNESVFRLGSEEAIIGTMKIEGYGKKWEMKAVSLNDDGDEYVIITGEYAKSTTDSDTLWIPKNQLEEFKKMVNSL